MEKIAIGSDHGGFELKEILKKYLLDKKFKVIDVGTYSLDRCDYPQFAAELACGVSRKKFKRGILICTSGIGVSIVANRFPGVRAALCYNRLAAQLSRQHNDSNVLVMGAKFVKPQEAKLITSVWLNTAFEGGRHARRVHQIKKIESKIRSCVS